MKQKSQYVLLLQSINFEKNKNKTSIHGDASSYYGQSKPSELCIKEDSTWGKNLKEIK